MAVLKKILSSVGTLVALAALSAALLPASAGAAAVTFGSSLAPGPTFGCDAEPNPTSDGTFLPSTKPDCTWWQSGVFGVPSDPRHGSVSVSGNVTSVVLYGGANPVPVRIMVARQLGFAGAGSDCCFFQTETGPLQPAPNAPTAFPLNIPLANNSQVGGIRADDYIGISMPNVPGGTAPLRVVGPTSPFAFTTTGSVNAAFLYPRFGSLPNDSGGGRREGGFAGVEVLAQWTFCPTGDPSCQPQVPPPPQATVAPAVANLARIQRGSALIRLVCSGNVVCEGQLEALNQGALAKASAKKITSYGKKSYKIAAGKKKTVKLKLNAKGKRLLKGRKKAKIALRITPKGGTATTKRLTLKK